MSVCTIERYLMRYFAFLNKEEALPNIILHFITYAGHHSVLIITIPSLCILSH